MPSGSLKHKDFLQSKTTWGATLLALSPLLTLFDINVDVETLAELITRVGGVVLVVYGQFTRRTRINSIGGIRIK